MDQIKELRTFKDLCEHEIKLLCEHEIKLTRDYEFSRWLYLCQYIGDVELFDVPSRYKWQNVSMTPIQRGTLQIFTILDRLPDYYDNPSKIVTLRVTYEMTPGETKFKKEEKKLIQVNLFQLFQNARLFHLVNIGKEISESFTPEDAARKYFGSSDFRTFFHMFPNRDYFNKRNTLKDAANLGLIPRYTESALTRIPLLGTHYPVKPIKSTFQKYWDAWDKVAPTDSEDSQRQWDAASNDLHRGMSAAFGALSLVPRVYNQKKKTDSEQTKQKQIQEMVEFVPKAERSSGLTKGALSTQLMQRLSQHPSVGQSDKIKTFKTLHNRVHSQSKPSGGSKKHKPRKTRKTRH
jgi:hypothetical protein